MAFEGLSEKLQGVFKNLKGKGSLSEKDINDAMREVKLALLEADVNFKVVKEFVQSVKEKALGEEVMKSLTPAQQVIKIVDRELTELMGGAGSKLTIRPADLRYCLWWDCRVPVRRPPAENWRPTLRKTAKNRCCAPATFIGRQPSISWKS